MSCTDAQHGGRRRRCIPLLRACSAVALAVAACAHMAAQHLSTSSFGSAAGLANLNATVLLEDHSGAVWVGTESGVYLADGQRFLKQAAFTEAGLEQIEALREDARGHLWALDHRHLVFWDGTAIHVIGGLDLQKKSDEARDLLVLAEDPDSIFLLAAGQLLRVSSHDGGRSWAASPAMRPEVLASHPELKRLRSLGAAAGSHVWAGCDTKLCRLDLYGGRVEVFDEAQGVPSEQWGAMLSTRDGTVWARASRKLIRLRRGAVRFEPGAAVPANVDLGVQLPLIVEDPNGRIVLNASDGIVRSVSQDGIEGWQASHHAEGLPEGELQALLFDHAGELWMAPQGLGIARTAGYGMWEGWTKAEGLRSNVLWSSVKGSDGTAWAITNEGLDRLDRGSGRFVPARSSLPLTHLRRAVLDARGHLWLGDADGRILDYDPETSRVRVAAMGPGRITHLMVDSRQRIWICSASGLRFFTPEDGWDVPHGQRPDSALQGHAWSIAEGPAGTLWVANGQGLFRSTGDTWTPIALPFPGGKEYNFMLAPAPDGTIWVQSKQPFPLLRLRVVGDRAEIVERVQGADFGSDNLTFMNTDRRGWLWVGSDDGVHVFNGTQWVQVDSEDGLLWDDTDFHAFFEDSDGTVWIGTSGGLSHLLFPERIFARSAPAVRLRTALVGESPLHGNNPSFDLRRPVLSVSLLNTNYDRGTAVSYRYRLEGQENEWQTTSDSKLRFPALDAGRYRLTVIACDARLHRSSAPVSLGFKVLEPWWGRVWFRWIMAAAGLLGGFALWRFSVRLLVRRQQRLERLIASRTRELEREKAELLSTRSALLEMTRRDSLTGLLNRGAIFEQMRLLCADSLASGRPLALAMADLDSFKRINDQYGHLTGDTVLRECARRVEGAVRSEDAAGRYGGEELLILMPGLYPESAAFRMEQLRVAIAGTPIVHGDLSLRVTCSFGVAWLGEAGCSLESLIALADAALYKAKQNGRNRVEFAPETTMEGIARRGALKDAVPC